jgi:hypothetical protein
MTADGPWTRAADVGLFSNQNVPLSHPLGTAVPEFRLKGVNEVFEGPFKLHELIDFAVRQLLPSNALIQPVGRPDWVPVNQFGILGDCLRGELSQNQTFVKHAPVPKTAEPLLWDPTVTSHDGPPPVISNVDAADLTADPNEDIDSILSDLREQMRKCSQERTVNKSKPKPKFRPNFKIAYIGGGQLWIGYLTNVDRTDASQSRGAGWVQLWPRDRATSLGPLDAEMRGTELLAR